MASLDLKVRVPLDNTTMTVEIEPILTREWHIRMWLGMFFLRMAARALGCNFQIDRGESE